MSRRSIVIPCLIACLSAAGAAPPPQPTKDDLALRKQAAERYLQFAQAAREQVLTPQSCPFSPAAVVMAVGNDPAKLAAFVRKQVAYEPYPGVVRGAEGTLAARSGGDWDRAVLMQALLIEAGYKSKLRVAARTPQESAAVVETFLKQPPTVAAWFPRAAGATKPSPATAPTPLIEQFGLTRTNREIYEARHGSRVRGLVAEALDAAAHETPLLLAAIETAAKPGQPFDAWRAKLLAGAAERVEVEIETPSGKSIVSVAPDASPVDAARFASVAALDAAPADKVAKLSVRLEMISREEGKPAAAAVRLIDRELALGELFRRPIRLEIVPSDEAAASKATASWTKADWFKFVSSFSTFQAILRVGDEWEGSKVFDLTGQLHAVAQDGRVDNASQIGSSVGRGLGGFGLGGGEEVVEKPAASKSRIESLVMVLEFALPGEKPQVQQRLIYGADRPGVTPVFTADALVTPAPISGHAITWMLLDAVTRNAAFTSRLATAQDPRRFEQTDDAARMPMMLYDWHTLRLTAASRTLAGEPGLTYIGGASLVMHAVNVATDASSQSVVTRHAMDVAFDGGLLLPRSPDQADRAARANATVGVASTVLESALLRSIDPAKGTRGAFAAFEEARVAGAAPAAVPASADAAGAVKVAPLVAWSLSRNEPGRALLFAGAQSPTSWWSIDPATGQTIGRGDGGEGQSAMEYLQITKRNIDNLKCMVGMSNQVLGGTPANETAQQFLLCMTGTDNPGSGHGIPGGIEGAIDPDAKLFDIGVGPLADALGGAKDLYDILNQNDPILYTGR